ncbi:MAG: hypothetical protein ACF8PG_05760 [Maioricimonas sp. JB045]|uniref:hypothetical protein n=1 Tax=Maioricimonas sp. JC845 TaxID=3232138 RepID=UPI003458D09B
MNCWIEHLGTRHELTPVDAEAGRGSLWLVAVSSCEKYRIALQGVPLSEDADPSALTPEAIAPTAGFAESHVMRDGVEWTISGIDGLELKSDSASVDCSGEFRLKRWVTPDVDHLSREEQIRILKESWKSGPEYEYARATFAIRTDWRKQSTTE